MPSERDSCLLIGDFSANIGKIERHVYPLAEVADVTMVCITAGDETDGIRYETVPSFGFRPVGLVLMFLLGLYEGLTGEYDAVVSFSLFPHGCFALAIGTVCGLPVHLGILGRDLEYHSRSRLRVVVRYLVRRFDAVSVPGSDHRRRVIELGVDPRRATILRNPVDKERFRPVEGEASYSFDFIWIGRLQPEKRPSLFVEALAELKARNEQFDAVIVGDGALRSEVEQTLRRYELEDYVELVGWADEPLEYYRKAKIFVLTSERDALPLTLVEALATGHACVTTDVGNVTDVAEDGRNAIVVDTLDPSRFATAMSRLLNDDSLYDRLAANAPDVRGRYSYVSATEDWERILEILAASE